LPLATTDRKGAAVAAIFYAMTLVLAFGYSKNTGMQPGHTMIAKTFNKQV